MITCCQENRFQKYYYPNITHLSCGLIRIALTGYLILSAPHNSEVLFIFYAYQ
jgi:hypothetical protein